MSEEHVHDIAEALGGEVEWMERLPDGSGAAVVAYPLPSDHWLTAPSFAVPPMPLRLGTTGAIEATILPGEEGRKCLLSLRREGMAELIREAARYAVRASTMNGQSPDFDPDAMVQNFVVGLIGYWSPDGRSSDEWANPPEET